MISALRRTGGFTSLLLGTAGALARHRLLGVPVPLSVTIAPTNRCPGRCSYCGIWESRQGDEQPPRFWAGLLGNLFAEGTRRVGFTGGEPLAYEGTSAIAAEARRLGMLVSMGSNGLLVPERREVLGSLDFLTVSLDGRREVNDAQRFEGSYEAATAAIRVAREQGTRVWLTSVVTRATASELPAWLGWIGEQDLRVNLQLPFHPEGYCGRDNAMIYPGPEQVAEILRIVRPHSRPGGVVLNSLAYWDHVERWQDLGSTPLPKGAGRPARGRRSAPCLAGRLFFHVEPDGRIYACTQLSNQVRALAPGPGVPLRKALNVAGDAPCVTCLSSYAQEQSLLFGVDRNAILTWAREVVAGKIWPLRVHRRQ